MPKPFTDPIVQALRALGVMFANPPAGVRDLAGINFDGGGNPTSLQAPDGSTVAFPGGGGAVDSVNGQTGVVTLDAGDIGLGNVDNTKDVDKPVSTLQAAAIAGKLRTGTYAARPAAASVTAGTVYVATDVGNETYSSDGAVWTVIGGGGTQLGYAEILTQFPTSSTTPVDITGLSLSLKIPERPFVISMQGSIGHSAANGLFVVQLVVNGVVQCQPAEKSINAGDALAHTFWVQVDPVAAGLTPGQTYVMKAQLFAHPSTPGTVTVYGGTSPTRQPASIRVNAQ